MQTFVKVQTLDMQTLDRYKSWTCTNPIQYKALTEQTLDYTNSKQYQAYTSTNPSQGTNPRQVQTLDKYKP